MPTGILVPEGAGKLVTSGALLEQAAGTGQVLQATASLCTESHDLVIELPGCIGVISKNEAALGVAQGTTKDIAIISRVGKPVSFTVTGRDEQGVWQLSRREAQLAALNYYMENIQKGDIISGCVTHMEGFGAFVDIGSGLISFIGIENISVSRISHPSQRFLPQQVIKAAVLDKDELLGRITLTHRELLGTWRQNAHRISVGSTIQGIVRGIEDYGVFVELSPNLSGLAEKRTGFAVGDRVSVYIKSIVPGKMKIKLLLIDKLVAAPVRLITENDYFITGGRLDHWVYTPGECDGKIIERRFDS